MDKKAQLRIAVIGGGMLGLAAAYYLNKSGYKNIKIYEKNDGWGGLAAGLDISGNMLERYYHHWFRSDESIQELIKELGLADKLNWYETTSGVFYQDKLHDFSTSLDILKFSPLNLIQRLRLGLVSFYLQKVKSYKQFETISAVEWCRKKFGNRVTEVLWWPLLRGKFGKFADEISMSWLWARVHDRSSSRAHPLAKEKLGYLDGGFQSLIDALVKYLETNGVKLESGVSILGHEYSDGKHNLKLDDKVEEFDIVISTLPGPIFTKLFKTDQHKHGRISDIKYIGAICVLLEIKQSVIPYYWLSIADEELPFMAVIEHTQLISSEKYKNKQYLYVAKYAAADDPIFGFSDERLLNEFYLGLKKINPQFSQDWVTQSIISRSAFAQHIVNKKYTPPTYQTNIPGLYFANFSQIYPHDRGTNYAIAQGKELAQVIGG